MHLSYQPSPIAQDILAYLIEHPQAADTLEGIIQWWILEQQIKRWSTQIEAALAELAARKLIIKGKGSDGQTRYRLNSRKIARIKALLEEEANDAVSG